MNRRSFFASVGLGGLGVALGFKAPIVEAKTLIGRGTYTWTAPCRIFGGGGSATPFPPPGSKKRYIITIGKGGSSSCP